jgi:hypothetical protein
MILSNKFIYARAEFDSVFGKVRVKWKREKNKIIFKLDYPKNAKGILVFEKKEKIVAQSGKYIYEL